jgi:hypothetical protein
MIHIVMGTSGEFSERIVWITGAFTDEAEARRVCETRKEADRSAHAMWSAWNAEFHSRARRNNLERTYYYTEENRAASAVALGMGPEPKDRGIDESEYYVVSVPVDVAGRYDYHPTEYLE